MTDKPDFKVLNIVSLSSGASSAICAKRVIDLLGTETVQLVFADVQFEDPDNYRFLADVENLLGLQVLVLTSNMTPYELFEKQSIIPNHRLAPCSYQLKTKLIRDYVKSIRNEYDTVFMHIGFDHNDTTPRNNKPNGRLDAPIVKWAEVGAIVQYPLLWKPIEYNPRARLKELGIEPPSMYSEGYTHANCGGCCPKQGFGDWIRTLIHHRDRYLKIEQWEIAQQALQIEKGLEPYTIMKKEVNGVDVKITLRQLREEYEASQNPTMFEMKLIIESDLAGNECGVECGVG